MRKKAQGISINAIIIAVIALVVLVVLLAIFTGRLGIFTAGTESCVNLGGSCKLGNNCPEGTRQTTSATCDANNICCIPIP